MPDGEYLDPGNSSVQAIERDVPGAAAGDDEFANVPTHRAADQRVIAQDASGIDDPLRGKGGSCGIVLGDEIEQSVEISQRPRAEGDGRQGRL
jgi:hypothetical protein